MSIFELEMAKDPIGNNVMIVDSLNLAFRYKHTKRRDFAEDYYRTVKSLAKSYNADRIILACDWGKSSYRKEIYPEYKADREEKVAQQTEEEKEGAGSIQTDWRVDLSIRKASWRRGTQRTVGRIRHNHEGRDDAPRRSRHDVRDGIQD